VVINGRKIYTFGYLIDPSTPSTQSSIIYSLAFYVLFIAAALNSFYQCCLDGNDWYKSRTQIKSQLWI